MYQLGLWALPHVYQFAVYWQLVHFPCRPGGEDMERRIASVGRDKTGLIQSSWCRNERLGR